MIQAVIALALAAFWLIVIGYLVGTGWRWSQDRNR